ncbi:MAG TPA: sugar phosphate isomerase/epimerase family protein [Terriglobia bacterium]|nr:sugar phosphate isomerase/epimerase family protein [Terriglobia bacterium]
MSRVERRDFLKAAGVSAAALQASSALGADGAPGGAAAPAAESAVPDSTKYPKLSMITPYSPEKLRFAAAAGYEGVVVPLTDFFDPDKLSDSQIDQILSTARDAAVRIVSIECMWGMNHIAKDPTERQKAQDRFIRCLEFGHRLGCKFVGTFSGTLAGAKGEDQAKALAEVANEKYMPVCDKLDLRIGWENYPCDVNFATVPDLWNRVFALVPNPRLGLEFDPSHLVRQYIDPIRAAWDVQPRIHAVHAKDTEITEAVLQKVGIHGKGWWRYRIPGQGLIDWPAFITVLLQAGFAGGIAVEHEDEFWDKPGTENEADFPPERKDGFILAHRFLSMYLPARPA